MAQHAHVQIPAQTWTLLTSSDVTAFTFQVATKSQLRLTATVGTTPPAEDAPGWLFGPGEGDKDRALTELFPGVTGANRVWGWMDYAGAVMVSHA